VFVGKAAWFGMCMSPLCCQVIPAWRLQSHKLPPFARCVLLCYACFEHMPAPHCSPLPMRASAADEYKSPSCLDTACSAVEAVRDLAVVAAMLESAAADGKCVAVSQIS